MKIAFIGIVAGIINGLFGSGSGMIILPILASNANQIKARGTTLMSVLFLSIISSIFYVKNLSAQIELQTIWYIVAGGIIGGAVGAKIVNKIPEIYLQILLAIFMIGTGIKMIINN